MDICFIIKGTCNNLIESGIKRHNPDPKIKGYLLHNLCAGSVNNEKDENVAICHLFCSLLKWI